MPERLKILFKKLCLILTGVQADPVLCAGVQEQRGALHQGGVPLPPQGRLLRDGSVRLCHRRKSQG
jgi:hypothetical protein